MTVIDTETADRADAPARIAVPVPENFDPDKHTSKVLERIEKKYGEGYRLESFDQERREVVAVREGALVKFSERDGAINALLPKGTQRAQGPKIAEEYESLKPGWKVTRFEPYAKPGFVTMEQLNEREIRVREALAMALRVQRTPWAVQIAERPDGGFDISVPPSYSPASHDDKLLEVAETAAGAPGWYCTVDPKTLMGKILPGELPTFPMAIPYDFSVVPPSWKSSGVTDWSQIPIGRALGRPGEEVGPEFRLDLKSASHTLLQGLPMSGKSVNINAFAYWMLLSGAEVVLIDTPDKAVDFGWLKPYVRENGWGPESYAKMVAACGLVYDEGKRRAEILKRRGKANWFEADDPEFRPIVLIADEYTGLMTEERVPKSLAKDHPMRVEAEETNGFKDMVGTYIQKIALEMRFVGVHVFISTQLGNTRTGVSTALKAASGNRFLMGPNASDNQRANAFNAPDAVALVPDNVKSAPGVSKGVGVSETEGQPSACFKGYYAAPEKFAAELEKHPERLRRAKNPEPTAAQIAKYTGSDFLDEMPAASTDPFGDREGSTGGRSGSRGSTSEGMRIAREQGLQGAAAANFAGRYDEAMAAKAKKAREQDGPAKAKLCSSCGKTIDANGNCAGCSR